jgi:hypothetical protein
MPGLAKHIKRGSAGPAWVVDTVSQGIRLRNGRCGTAWAAWLVDVIA